MCAGDPFWMGDMGLSADQTLELLNEAGRLNLECECRHGHVLRLPDFGQVVMTGDLHGYRPGFEALRHFADLNRCPQRHIVLHEIIHVSSASRDALSSDHDLSLELLLEALQWKCEFPDQVHFLMGNHDLAQWTNREISKGGSASISWFNAGIAKLYGDRAQEIVESLNQFIASLALMARCPNRMMLSHSLPSPYAMEAFDPNVLYRHFCGSDLLPGGSVYELLWGRGQIIEELDVLAKMFDVDRFIVGHQSQPEGYARIGERLLILASDHPMGCFLPIDLSKSLPMDDLEPRIRFFYQMQRLGSH